MTRSDDNDELIELRQRVVAQEDRIRELVNQKPAPRVVYGDALCCYVPIPYVPSWMRF